MIVYLKGKVRDKTDKYLILENNNIGYRVFTSEIILNTTKPGDKVELYTHQYVKEDALDLYGFSTLEELNFFEHLISISGVGPKSALAVLSIAKISDIKKAIFKDDPTLLKKVSGIGQKTAERIVVELKNKIKALSGPGSALINLNGDNSEVIDALSALGYKDYEIRQALSRLPDDLTDTQDKIKAILKYINKK